MLRGMVRIERTSNDPLPPRAAGGLVFPLKIPRFP